MSGVHACLSTGPMSSVRCGRLSVQVSAVRRPVSASGVGVRCLCVAASAVSGRSEVLERGGGAGSRTAGMAGVGVVARCVHARLVVCLSRSLVLEAGAGGAGPAEASVWTWPSSREVVGSGQHDRVADQDRPGAREDHSLVGAGAQRARLLRQADRHAAGESLGRSCRESPTSRANRTHPVSKAELNSSSIYQILLNLFSPFSPATSSSLRLQRPIIYPHMPLSFVLSSP